MHLPPPYLFRFLFLVSSAPIPSGPECRFGFYRHLAVASLPLPRLCRTDKKYHQQQRNIFRQTMHQQQRSRSVNMTSLCCKNKQKPKCEKLSREGAGKLEISCIAHISHNRHNRQWCSFFKPVYFLAFWPILANLHTFWHIFLQA